MPFPSLSPTTCRFVAVRNLPPTWNIGQHFYNSFGKLAEDFDCKASAATPIPHYEDSGSPAEMTSQSTILTILGTESHIDKVLKKLQQRDVLTARVEVDEHFLGLFEVAESQNSDCDFYFVHGLGGHALYSWASEPDTKTLNPGSIKLWPRDFLLRSLERSKIYSTIYTLGYNANVFNKPNVAAQLDVLAANLISHLSGERELALRSLLQEEREQSRFASLDPNSRWLFVDPSSLRADQLSPFIEILKRAYPRPTNSGLIGTLRATDPDQQLYHLCGEVDQIIQRYNVEVLVGYETQPKQALGVGRRPIVDYNSARGVFTKLVPICLNGDHSGIIKFPSANADYRNLANHIIQMVQRRCRPTNEAESHDQFLPGLPDFSLRQNATPSVMPDRRFTEPVASASAYGNYMNLTINLGPERRTFDINNPTNATSLGTDAIFHTHERADRNDVHTRQTTPPMTRYQSSPAGIHHQPPDSENYNCSDLRFWDTAFLIDDTDSMFVSAADSRHQHNADAIRRWGVLKESLSYLVPVATEYDSDGIDLYFLKSEENETMNVIEPTDVEAVLNEIEFNHLTNKNGGGTYFKARLRHIIQPRLDDYDEFRELQAAGHNPDPLKPLNLIVITDGEADDPKPTEAYLVEVATKLDELHAPHNHIGIQFVQIGDDTKAAQWLKKLDNDDGKSVFANYSSSRRLRDIIDTVPFTST